MERILTTNLLWQDFDPEKESLDPNFLKIQTDGNLETDSVYFTGRKVADGQSRVFAKVCKAIGKTSKQAVLFIGDYCKPIDDKELEFWAQNGFVAMAVDYAGRTPKGGCTIYPDSLNYCNADVAGDYFSFGATVRESKIYEYALNSMRAITYLLREVNVKSISVVTVKRGARVGVVVLGTDSRIANGTVAFNSLYAEFPPMKQSSKVKNSDDSLEKRLAWEDRCQMWTTGLAPQTYAIQIKAPIYFILSANSPDVDLIRANKMFYRLNSQSRILLLPSVLDCIPSDYMSGLVKWCKIGVITEDISLKKLALPTGDNYVAVQTKFPLSRLNLWYSRNIAGGARNWVSAPLKKTDDGYVAELDVYRQESSVLAFVFASGTVNYTTPLCEIKIEKPRKVKITTQSIYVGTCESNIVPFSDGDEWHGQEAAVEYTSGYLGIRGAKSKGLATFAINDPAVRSNGNFTISFDICCSVPQELKVFATTDFGATNVRYGVGVQLNGDGKWQRITVEQSRFKTADGRLMSEDAKVQMLAFAAEKEFIVNNIFWV